MKFKLLIFFLVFQVVAFAQDRVSIKGRLIYRNINVVAANVVNITAQINTITNGEGAFEIPVKNGDEVVFSSVQYMIRTVKITPEIIQKNRLIITINEKINALEEVVVTPDDAEKFLDLKEEEFKGFNYDRDKSTRLENSIVRQGQLKNGINLINVAKLIAKLVSNKTEEEKRNLKPSEVLSYVFDKSFFSSDLELKDDQIVGFLEHIDNNLPSQKLLNQSQQFQLIDYLILQSKKYRSKF
ncbi:MAG: hypothetical protein ACJ0QA_05165 [Flavobacteriaceae bacterium]|tara:strand:+ start:1915 stop:2637 length:723 start_codon:yes stop_codon:yes gene_type:complete